MAPYSRNPGPWKRYADAAGGDADAGALFDHILLRYRTADALHKRWSALWIVQSVRAWQQEVPLSAKRIERAIKRLKKADLIEVKVEPMEHSPTRFTHIRLTAHGAEFLKATGGGAKSSDRSKRLRRIDHDDSVISAESARPTGCQNSLLNTSSEMEGSEISLAPDGARDGEFRSENEGLRKEEERGSGSTKAGDSTTLDFQDIWRDAHRQHRPELPCSPLFGPRFHYAKHIAQALGSDLEQIVHAVVKGWTEFRCYVISARGASKFSAEPDVAALAIHVDATRAWLRHKAEIDREREEGERFWSKLTKISDS
jgi:hypothetical protein